MTLLPKFHKSTCTKSTKADARRSKMVDQPAVSRMSKQWEAERLQNRMR